MLRSLEVEERSQVSDRKVEAFEAFEALRNIGLREYNYLELQEAYDKLTQAVRTGISRKEG
ncbi:MAG: hypothetical protein A2857_01020 [Candidatus Levybacteria bacterium RIFCSPHIGHO2_01_FULL_36_15]|nr:MAG: hypothetical protein A2857_01020 [Candidatus Levybacteria bacterium RIFCSPHIGHO2_01_FULL_36_15]